MLENFKKCPNCGVRSFLNTHKCDPIFYVSMRESGQKTFFNDLPEEVYAEDAEEAARKYVERFDHDLEYDIASSGLTVDVFVFTHQVYDQAQEVKKWLKLRSDYSDSDATGLFPLLSGINPEDWLTDDRSEIDWLKVPSSAYTVTGEYIPYYSVEPANEQQL